MDVRIRRAQPSDDAFILELGSVSAVSSISSVRPVDDAAAALSFTRLLEYCRERPGTVEFLGECGGKPAGFLVLLTGIPDDVTQLDQGFIAYMAVEPALRGRGVGGALIAAAENETRRLGLTHLSLMVTAENAEARRLYERNSFAPERVLMTKRLAAMAPA